MSRIEARSALRIIARVFGLKKVFACLPVVVVSGTLAGWSFGNFVFSGGVRAMSSGRKAANRSKMAGNEGGKAQGAVSL